MKSLKEFFRKKDSGNSDAPVSENNSAIETTLPQNDETAKTRSIMLDIIIALLPSAFYGCLLFGLRALVILLISIASAVVAELLWNLILRKPISIGDLSAIVTGLLLGMSYSFKIPFWIAVIGSFIAIIVFKQLFGGFGKNLINPALAARIILSIAFYKHMSAFYDPFTDALTSATPLADESLYSFKSLFFGQHAGCIGETSAFLLILGGLYLILRRVINPIIPFTFIGSISLLSVIFGSDFLTYIFGGGLLLASIFMATDYTTSPKTIIGKIIFGLSCGIITFFIRRFTPAAEGVAFAIIIMNVLSRYLDRLPPMTVSLFEKIKLKLKPKKSAD